LKLELAKKGEKGRIRTNHSARKMVEAIRTQDTGTFIYDLPYREIETLEGLIYED